MAIEDGSITLIEGLNARDLRASTSRIRCSSSSATVSFISLKLALPAALDLAEEGAWLVALIKPQFEAGRDALGKGGIVTGETDLDRILRGHRLIPPPSGLEGAGAHAIAIEAGDGNKEFLIAAQKG